MSDETNELNEQIRNLTEQLRDITEMFKSMSQSQSEYMRSISNSNNQNKAAHKAMDDLGKASASTNTAMKNLSKSTEEVRRQEEERNMKLKAAAGMTEHALKSLAGAVFNTERSFSKYNSALNDAGEAVATFGSSLGPLGDVLGRIAQGGLKVVEQFTKQTDASLKARDSMNDMGAAGTITAEEVRKMGNRAGLAAESLDALTNPLKSLNSGLLNLGGTVSDGMNIFGEMIKTSYDLSSARNAQERMEMERMQAEREQERMALGRIGYGPEDIIAGFADFIKLQETFGSQIMSQYKTTDELRKASVNYLVNLKELSALTGQDAETLKQRQRDAANDAAFQIRQYLLDEEGKGDIAKIEKEMLGKVSGFGDPVMTAAFTEWLATGGNIYDRGVPLALRGMDLGGLYERLQTGDESAINDAIQSYFSGSRSMLGEFGQTAIYSPELREVAGLQSQGIIEAARRENYTEQALQVANDVLNGMKEGVDAAADVRAKLTEIEIDARTEIENLIGKINPLQHGFTAATIAAGAFTAATVAATFALGKLSLGKFGGMSGDDWAGPGSGPNGGKGGGRLGRLRVPRGSPAAIVSGLAIGAASQFTEEGSTADKTLSTTGDILSYAGTGAMLGSFLGPVGTATGAALGAGYGAFRNWDNISGMWKDDESEQDDTIAEPAPLTTPQDAGVRITDDQIKAYIRANEDTRSNPYLDTEGNWTIGVGHNLGKHLPRGMTEHSTISQAEIDRLFEEDYQKHKAAAEKLPGYNMLDDRGKMALIDMTFNMGPNWMNDPTKWPKLQEALRKGDKEGILREMQDSKYFGQVGNRSKANIGLMQQAQIISPNPNLSLIDSPNTRPTVSKPTAPEVVPASSTSTPTVQREPIVGESTASDVQRETIKLSNMLNSKLDTMISKISESNDFLDKLARYSTV